MIKRERVVELIRQEHRLRPEAELIDYYKLLYQGSFGPGHMVHDKDSAREFLKHELLRMHADPVPDGTPIVEDIGWYGRYYRVNLTIISSGDIGLEDFLDAFIESAQVKPLIHHNRWRKMWTEINQILHDEIKALKSFEEQKREIEQAFELENPLFHHSSHYRERYHPHYRVIHANFMNMIRKELR